MLITQVGLAADPALDPLAAPDRNARADGKTGPRIGRGVGGARAKRRIARGSGRQVGRSGGPGQQANRGRGGKISDNDAHGLDSITGPRPMHCGFDCGILMAAGAMRARKGVANTPRNCSLACAGQGSTSPPISRDPLRLDGVRGAQVAQLVEHATENRSVGGSIPPLGTIKLNGLPTLRAIPDLSP